MSHVSARTPTTAPVGVFGATGQQGGAVVDALLDAGQPVRAVVRRTGSDGARSPAERGVEVVAGDQDDPDGLVEALSGLSALFLMTSFADESGVEGEARRGMACADAAAQAGVPRVVYSSVGGADRDSGVPHFESKHRVEQHLASVLRAQFVRPTFFMENLLGQVESAEPDEFVLRLPMPGDVPLQMVSVRDIGIVAAAALQDSDVLGGASLEIAGDELTGEQTAERIGEHLRKTARFEQLPLDVMDDDPDRQKMFRWFSETSAYRADFDGTRRVDPGVLDLSRWLAASLTGFAS